MTSIPWKIERWKDSLYLLRLPLGTPTLKYGTCIRNRFLFFKFTTFILHIVTMDSLQSMLTMEKKCKNECFLSFVVKIFSSPIHVTKNHFQKWSSWYEKKKLKILGRRDRLLQLIKERKSPNNVPKNYTLSRSWINMLLIISSYSIDIDTIQQSESN